MFKVIFAAFLIMLIVILLLGCNDDEDHIYIQGMLKNIQYQGKEVSIQFEDGKTVLLKGHAGHIFVVGEVNRIYYHDCGCEAGYIHKVVINPTGYGNPSDTGVGSGK